VLFIYSHPRNEVADDVIVKKFGTAVDLTYVMTAANFGCCRLNGGHYAVVKNVPFPYNFNGWPYNIYYRQALRCCRYNN